MNKRIQNIQDRKVAKNARDDIEDLLGESIINSQNKLNYKYVDKKLLKH